MPLRSQDTNGQARIEVKRLTAARTAIITATCGTSTGAAAQHGAWGSLPRAWIRSENCPRVRRSDCPRAIGNHRFLQRLSPARRDAGAGMRDHEQVAAEDKPDYREVREVLRTKAQSDLIDFLNTELDLAFSTLQTAHLEQGDDQERYQTTIGDVRLTLETVRRFDRQRAALKTLPCGC